MGKMCTFDSGVLSVGFCLNTSIVNGAKEYGTCSAKEIEIAVILDFIAKSSRGIIRFNPGGGNAE